MFSFLVANRLIITRDCYTCYNALVFKFVAINIRKGRGWISQKLITTLCTNSMDLLTLRVVSGTQGGESGRSDVTKVTSRGHVTEWCASPTTTLDDERHLATGRKSQQSHDQSLSRVKSPAALLSGTSKDHQTQLDGPPFPGRRSWWTDNWDAVERRTFRYHC